MHFTLFCVLCLIVTGGYAHFVPKDASEMINFPKTNEFSLGSQCQKDGLQGTCKEMEKCTLYAQIRAKAENDPCLNLLQTIVVCCINSTATGSPRLDSSSEEVSTDRIQNA
uniref:Clip domain-containing protein n=1 Tax=Anopheles christyi TaxID=43041 RepID=A0A182JNP5_9DIPT